MDTRRTDGWAYRWLNGQMDGRMDGWTDRRMDGRTDGRIDGRMDGWTDGRRDPSYRGKDASRNGKLPQTGVWEKGGVAVPISRDPNDLKFDR